MDCARGACRSCRRVRARGRGADRGRRKWCATTPSAPSSAWRRAGCASGPRWEPAAHPARRQAESGDRKSTRLNSSHDQISYAVFCLKKKKKFIVRCHEKLFALANPLAQLLSHAVILGGKCTWAHRVFTRSLPSIRPTKVLIHAHSHG